MSKYPPSSFAPYAALGAPAQFSPTPTTAEVRSQAAARLKRAAFLPRNPENRRPSQNSQDQIHQTPEEKEAGPSSLAIHPIHYDAEEVLSPSPIAGTFSHSALSPPMATGMQRSASSSSSYHIPTPPYMIYGQTYGTPYYSNTSSRSGTPDWSSMQLAQTYIPSLSPAGMPASPFMPTTGTSVLGRNTPSPLPTLGELRTLSRSNSAAARARAMDKLTGGKETPSDEDHTIQAFFSRPNLQRADSLGAPRVLDLAMSRATRRQPAEEPSIAEPTESRPRLHRSFTVSSTNMGEERRSAVGRRMVERLAKSKAAKDEVEVQDEVRQLWEQRRGVPQEFERSEEYGSPAENETTMMQLVETPIPSESPRPEERRVIEGKHLAPPDRSASQNTMRSGEEAFEYEAHLRRSLSSRTARGGVGGIVQAVPNPEPPMRDQDVEQLHNDRPNPGQPLYLARPLSPPRPAYATPTRHVQQDSTSTNGTARGSTSPSKDSMTSRDALGSVMFIVGRGSGSGPSGGGKEGESNWPIGVEDNNGSDWGTPAKHIHQPTFSDSPLARSPLAPTLQCTPSQLALYQTMQNDESLTPPGGSQRTSVMSWEEVGGPDDREVPMDYRYNEKSGSMSAKIGRNIRTAMRKRSQSRSSRNSVTSSNRTSSPTSPKVTAGVFHNQSRRSSEASATPSQGSVAKYFARDSPAVQAGEHVRQQASVGSLSPLNLGQPELSENSILLQHQLAADPSMLSYLPRAELNDPRIHSSKLSPFPGIASLERRSADSTTLNIPSLVHQISDSAVPSQQRVNPAIDPTYALPLPPASPIEPRRTSEDSVGKRSWLTKAFGQQTSPRSSSSVSRTSSIPELGDPALARRKPSADGHPSFAIPASESDPFAGPPMPTTKPSRHHSASPSVSMVPEVNEEGSRFTRFTTATQRVDEASPFIEEEEPEINGETIPQKSIDVLNRMDDLLALAPDDPARPDVLDDPPRKLLLATHVLQVVNVNTAKDRFLFLFNDILVITKPLITSGVSATLDMKFLVKSIVGLDKIHISGFDPEPTTEPERHPLVQRFIEQFAEDPTVACRYLVERSNPRVDALTLASLIFKTSELDKEKIGVLLAGNEKLLRAFLDRFHFTGMRIDHALRMFLLSLRFPSDDAASDTLLRGFAYKYHQANEDTVTYDASTATDLVMSIMQLNETLYGMDDFKLASSHLNEDVFISAWRAKDPEGLFSNDLLSNIFSSVRDYPLAQALEPEVEEKQGRPVVMSPARLPSKMTYNTWSESIRISIPSPDPNFGIELLGEGLEFDPPILALGDTREAVFRVRGKSLGTNSILFYRVGRNAALYASLGNTRTFSVERAFMSHTFHVAFLSHTASKRKYCFSVPEAETRSRCGNLLRRQMQAIQVLKPRPATTQEWIRQAAEGVALQVLRDAVIPPHEKTSDRPVQKSARSGSVSIAYDAQAGRNEAELGPLQPSKPSVGSERMGGMMGIQTGKELVLLCRQNSLLPGLLELLQAGIGSGPGPGPGQEVAHDHIRENSRPHEHELTRKEGYRARAPGGMV